MSRCPHETWYPISIQKLNQRLHLWLADYRSVRVPGNRSDAQLTDPMSHPATPRMVDEQSQQPRTKPSPIKVQQDLSMPTKAGKLLAHSSAEHGPVGLTADSVAPSLLRTIPSRAQASSSSQQFPLQSVLGILPAADAHPEIAFDGPPWPPLRSLATALSDNQFLMRPAFLNDMVRCRMAVICHVWE